MKRTSWLVERCYPAPGCWLALPQAFEFILAMRADLAHFDPAIEDDRLALFLWWEREGRLQFPDLVWCLTAEEVESVDRLSGAVLLAQFQKSVECWLRGRWPSQLSLPGLRASLMDTSMPLAESGFSCPLLIKHLWGTRLDLQQNHQLSATSGQAGLLQWWERGGQFEYPRWTWSAAHLLAMPAPRTLAHLPAGVNIVGYPYGALGLGEDARLASRGMDLAGVSNVLVNAPQPGPKMLVDIPSDKVSQHLAYQTTLYCMPPVEMMRMGLEGGQAILEAPGYKIGAMPWELPHWPQVFGKVFQFVDELWVHSRFVEAAYRECCELPILHMPMAVEVPQSTRNIRLELGLPMRDFLYCVMFDGNSWLSRKNPLAAVQAFSRAFPLGLAGVALVVKAMNVRPEDPQWQQLCKLASSDHRIRIINQVMSRDDSFNLIHSCDAYISLHRSEGFGRVIAESMLMGKPVVVTNFSGNVDFCSAETACLVDGELVPLKPGDYLLAEGQYWCEPDVDAASMHLQSLVEDGALRQRIAAAGQSLIADQYSLKTVARRYAERLAAIAGKVNGEMPRDNHL